MYYHTRDVISPEILITLSYYKNEKNNVYIITFVMYEQRIQD